MRIIWSILYFKSFASCCAYFPARSHGGLEDLKFINAFDFLADLKESFSSYIMFFKNNKLRHTLVNRK